ncbi:MAG: glycosyltransferase [Gemmatimonadetes bacterium]|nr:MAG: glycosyltransferase [Gemmatimonadota bacterium]
MVRRAHVVLAGNDHLAEYARAERGSGQGVHIVPTVVDTERFRPAAGEKAGVPGGDPEDGAGGAEATPGPTTEATDAGDPPTLGWVGTHSTLRYLADLYPTLVEARRRTPFRLRVVCNRPPEGVPEALDVVFERWTPEREVAHFHGLRAGLYPLPDDPWTRGKCGFKALQYLACGVPAIASPVGVLARIVREGETGFQARTPEDWTRAVEVVCGDPARARALGRAGRALVERDYSVPVAADALARALREALR